MKPITLSVFFPVYNERENLPLVIERTTRVLEESPFVRNYEILLVDDGSTDGSGDIADEFERGNSRIRAIHHDKNRGYGNAVKSGLTGARMEYVFFTDADLQFDIVELNALLAHLPEYKAVIGYRAPRRDPFMRLVNAWGWNLMNRVLFGLSVRDIDCAFKVFHRPLVQGLKLESTGAMVSAETLIRLSSKGIPMKEVPVSHLPRERGRATGARLDVIYRAFAEMVELYRGELGKMSGRRERTQVFRFIAVGVVNTILDAAMYIALTRGTVLFSEHLLAAKLFSFLAGTVSSLALNRSWTFGMQSKLSATEIARFYAVTSISLVVNVILMDIFTDGLGIYDLYALVLTTGFTFIFNFLLSKFWVFNRGKRSTLQRQYATS